MYLFILAMLGLCWFVGFSLFVESGSYPLVGGAWRLTAVASLVAEHGLQGVWVSVVAPLRLRSCATPA